MEPLVGNVTEVKIPSKIKPSLVSLSRPSVCTVHWLLAQLSSGCRLQNVLRIDGKSAVTTTDPFIRKEYLH